MTATAANTTSANTAVDINYFVPVARFVLRVDIRGKPIPQGSVRHLGKNRPSVHGNQATLLPWREHVQHCIEAAMRDQPLGRWPGQATLDWPLTGPVTVTAVFTMRKPVGAPKRKRTWPTKQPDTDKLFRAVGDALQNAGVVRNDSQIVTILASKVFPNEARDALDTPGVRLYVALGQQ